ncbi:MAG: LysR substrate-binding domain-containing protein [Actinomycetota bacterium]
MSRPTLRQLEYAVALADHLHFGDAAAAVHVSQPALSAQIRELEDRLGVALFERGTAGTVLTSVGHEVVDRARAVLGSIGELESTAAAHAGVIRGEIRIGAIPTVAPYLLPPIVDRLRTEWPDARIVIEELQSRTLLAAMDAGNLDLGVLATPYDTGHLHCEPLADEPFHLAVPSDHPLAESTAPVPLDVLASLTVLLLPEGHCLREHARQACDIAGRSEHSEVRASSIATLSRMVASGMGATLLPASAEAIESRPGSGITTRPFSDPPPGRTIALLWRPTDPRRDLFAALVPALRDDAAAAALSG